MGAVAIKKSSREKTAGLLEMGTLRCDGCGEEFILGHNPTSVDRWVAEKQAKWAGKGPCRRARARQETPRPNRTA